jgi:hypothetical protein
MSPEIKYAILKQGFEMDRLHMPDFIQGGTLGFQYKSMNLQSPFAGGGTGGNMQYGGSTGT